MTPPANSAFFSKRLPKMLPIFTPMADRAKVVTPIREAASQIFVFPAMAREMPTASASMEVATAIRNMVLTERSAETSSSFFERASRIIFAPIKARRVKAIQWSMASMASANRLPRKYPIIGIRA